VAFAGIEGWLMKGLFWCWGGAAGFLI